MSRPSLFRHGDFLKLWGGQTISEVGSQISTIALPLTAVLVLRVGPLQIGVLSALQFLPFIVVGLPAGVWVDRLRRRPILIVADVGRLLAMSSIPLAALFHVLTLTQLYVVALCSGTLTVFFDVAYQSYLPTLVSRQQIIDGNAKLEVTRSTAEFVGPGLGGVLVGWLTAPIAIAADALSYAVSVFSLLLIRRQEAAPPRAAARSLRGELVEGLRYVLGHRVLRLIAACTGTYNLFSHIGTAVLILYAVRDVGLTPVQIGLWFALGGLGVPLGAALAPRLARWLGIGTTLIVSVLIGASSALLIPLAPRQDALVFFIASGLIGSIGVAYNITQVSLRQTITPAHLLGRMNATMRFLVWGPFPLGALAGGVLGSLVGLHTTLWIGAIGTFLAVLPLLSAPIRQLRHVDDLTAAMDSRAQLEAQIESRPTAG